MNTIESLAALKETIGGRIHSNKLIANCPSCGKVDHFYCYANIDSLYSTCYVCGYSIRDYNHYIRGYKSHGISSEIHNKFVLRKMLVTSDLPAVWTIKDEEFKPAYNYLKSRGIDDSTIRNYNLSLGKEYPWKGRVIFYVLDEYGSVLFLGGRTIDDKIKPRYYYPEGSSKSEYVFNLTHIDKSYTYAVVVEGPFDCIISRIPNAVSIMGSHMSKAQTRLLINRFKNFVVWLDADALDKAYTIANELLKFGGVKIVRQRFGSDPGDCPCVDNELNSAKDYFPSDYVVYKMKKERS